MHFTVMVGVQKQELQGPPTLFTVMFGDLKHLKVLCFTVTFGDPKQAPWGPPMHFAMMFGGPNQGPQGLLFHNDV